MSRWQARDFGKPEDFTGFLNHGGICLIEGEGGALFFPAGPGTYEVHVFFEQRGKAVLELSHRMLDYMRRSRGAHRFVACIPYDDSKQSRRIRMFTRLMGWKSLAIENGHEIFQSE